MALSARDLLTLFGYGTSEGATKGWDTRGRGRNANTHSVAVQHGFSPVAGTPHLYSKTAAHPDRSEDVQHFLFLGPGSQWQHTYRENDTQEYEEHSPFVRAPSYVIGQGEGGASLRDHLSKD